MSGDEGRSRTRAAMALVYASVSVMAVCLFVQAAAFGWRGFVLAVVLTLSVALWSVGLCALRLASNESDDKREAHP